MSLPTRREAHHGGNGRPIYDMALPFDPNDLVNRAQARGGMSVSDAQVFAHTALAQLRRCHASSASPVTALQVAEAIKEFAKLEVEKSIAKKAEKDAEQARRGMNDSTIEEMEDEKQDKSAEDIKLEEMKVDGRNVKRFTFANNALNNHFGGNDPYDLSASMSRINLRDSRKDIITLICGNIELAVELGSHLRPEDIVNLYIASRSFNNAVSGYMLSTVRTWIGRRCPEAGNIFPFKFYRSLLIPDPKGRTWEEHYPGKSKPMDPERAQQIRSIPGLKYLQLVLVRHRCCREITAIMARNGHRMPDTMYSTLLRMWLLTDIATTHQRRAMMRNKEIWTDQHLYNAQLLFVKLGMHFNDPVFGPSSYDLLHVILGQKGLYPLWQLLMRKNFTKITEILEAKVRYDFKMPHDHWGHDFFDTNVHGVPFREIGTLHLENWGRVDKHLKRSDKHLMRPDELVPCEAVMRGLRLDDHIRHMILWGYFDWKTGENLVPTESEIYISDEETTLAHMDTDHHWKKKHALKKRWKTLTPEQQQSIIDEDADEQLRALAWAGIDDTPDEVSVSDLESEPYDPNDEITRGFIVRPQSPDHKSTVPAPDDKRGWANFVNKALIGLAPDIDEDEALRAQGWRDWRSYGKSQEDEWQEWIKQEGNSRGRSASTNTEESSTEIGSVWEGGDEWELQGMENESETDADDEGDGQNDSRYEDDAEMGGA